MNTETPRPLAEFTFKAVLTGLALGVVFGGANAYLGLKAGLTVSTSIPIAVLAATLFKVFPRGGTILESNMAQTVGSASSSLASGTIFTIPALYLWGLQPTLTQVALLAMAGGLLGILAMVPLRRLLMVQAAAELPYPEGRACAEVLQATERGTSSGRWIVIGIAIGIAVKLVVTMAHLLPEAVQWNIASMPNASIAISIAPALLAVGYIVGFRASAVMVSGGLIAGLVLYPLVTKSYASGSLDTLADASKTLTAKATKDRFITFLGAGAVAAAGLLTVIRTAPTMLSSFRAVVAGMKSKSGSAEGGRTDRDIPGWLLVTGLVVLALFLAFVPNLFAGVLSQTTRILAAVGVVFFGFLFVPVSSRLVGVIGVSSNPTSAMALITIAGTASVFLALGYSGLDAKAAVLTVGTVVCVAASKAGDISQDLKTGQMVKASPYLQQYGQLIAAMVACWAVAAVVTAIGMSKEGFGEGGMPAPQANLMKTVTEAVLGDQLPWDLLCMGGVLALVGALVSLPALPFALGLYLPLSTLVAVFAGGVVRYVVEKRDKARTDADVGILCASGFVAGEGLAGVAIAGITYYRDLGRHTPTPTTLFEGLGGLALLGFAAFVLWRSTHKRA